MSIVSLRSPERGYTRLLLIAGFLAVLGIGGWWVWDQSVSASDTVAFFEQRLPERPSVVATGATPERSPNSAIVAGQPANSGFTQPELDEIKPAAPDLDLVDASPTGPLPRISADGRRSLLTYGRPFDRSDERPKIAIMITGLGPQADPTNAALHLPADISLSFSPYAEDLPTLFERARLAGHEVLIELPMEPEDYPANDPGPHTLRVSGTVDANLERLTWVLSRAPGYVAVTGATGAFGSSAEAVPVIDIILERGLGMVEIDGDAMSAQAEQSGLPYTYTRQWLDDVPSAESIDQALIRLEAEARDRGTAIGVAEAYPITLQRLAKWAEDLEQQGIALVPVSAILIERNGLLDASRQASGSNIAQSQN